ncbi:MAG: phosphoribosylformylglycinamidine cyclo-ligase [Phycisphaerae bacterium]|nr:phosphoribosylformylglycinamidine cyclo-ligase [Phycisphaerae bacterium]
MRDDDAAPATESESSSRGLTYAQSGVDIDAGDEVVDLIKPILRRTHGPRVIGRHGAFAGMFRLDWNEKLFKRNYREPVLVACTDGVGTKVLLAVERSTFHTVGIDCVAMNVNDLIVQGAEPLFFLDYLGLSRVKPKETASMIEGVARGCEIAGCALIGGECAEMPDIYKPGDFDIAGFAVGVVELDRAMDATRVRKGDVVIGLASSGIHSNGYSLVRRIVKDARLNLDERYEELAGSPVSWIETASVEGPDGPRSAPRLIDVLLEPTRIYAKPIVRLLKSYKRKKVISGMAHITGGGIPGNLCRALGEQFDAIVDRASWAVPPIFRFLQRHGGVAEEEMWRVFNMGIGYMLVVRPNFVDGVLRKLRKYGENAFVCGSVEKGSGQVRIV